MPAAVDHESRRRLVAERAADLVSHGGIEALTVRNLAQGLGLSTAAVSHYFKDKQELLLLTYRLAAERAGARFEAASAASAPRLAACLESLLPMDALTRGEWTLFHAFWGIAVANPDLASEQQAHVRSARRRIERVLVNERDAGHAPADLDVRAAARALLVVVHGIGVQAVFDPTDWSAPRQRRLVREQVERVVTRTR